MGRRTTPAIAHLYGYWLLSFSTVGSSTNGTSSLCGVAITVGTGTGVAVTAGTGIFWARAGLRRLGAGAGLTGRCFLGVVRAGC